MKLDRRKFIASMASTPLVVIGPKTIVMAAEAPMEAVAKPPVVANPWRWWVSLDGGERYVDSFETREEAVADAEVYDCGRVTIAECVEGRYQLNLDADEIYSLWENNNDEMGDPDGDGFDLQYTKEQGLDLERRVNQAIREWVAANDIKTRAWVFADIRNEETIEIKQEPDNA